MTTTRLELPELTEGQAVPEATVNEIARYLSQGAGHFVIKDRDLTAPPGSPADEDAYIVAASPTGAWAGKAGEIAFYMSSAWLFITPKEGFGAYINDEDAFFTYDGTNWNAIGAAEASDSEIWTGSNTSKIITPRRLFTASAEVTLTDGATITPDFNTGINFKVTLGGNRTLANPTNAKSGQSGVIVVSQDGTGSRTLVYGGNWRFPGGSASGGVLSTAANTVDTIAYFVRADGSIIATLTKAFAS
jgi:hypothetical protein